jgi:hypothetical protein
MIGRLGWAQDIAVPTLTLVACGLAVAWLAVLAVAVGSRRHRLVLVGLGVLLTVVFPAVLVGAGANTYPPAGWVGRYELPLAVGFPLVAAFVLDRRRDEVARLTSATATLVAGAFVIGQLAAYAALAHRYVAGSSGPVLYVFHVDWEPELPPLLLLVVAVVAYVALAWRVRRSIADASPVAAPTPQLAAS